MKRWLVLSIGFGSIVAATFIPRSLQCCAFGPEPEDYRFSSFLPFIYYKPVYASFNFCSPLFFDTENKAGIEADRQRNLDEWLAFTKNAVSRDAIYQVLYATLPSDFEQAVTGQRLRGDTSLLSNAFLLWMLMPEHRAVKEYMRYAKYSEVISSMMADPWEEDLVEDIKAESFVRTWQAVYDREQDPFLRERYAFQFLRLHFYLEDYDASLAEYERSFAKSRSTSVIRPWAEEYYGMIFRYREDRIRANYHLARSFGACDDKKLAAVMYFTRDSLEATLDLARNDKERFNILATAITNTPYKHLETLAKLYKLDPRNDILEMLAAREINKCEDWLLSRAVTGDGPAMRPSMPEIADWSDYDEAYDRSAQIAYRQDLAYAKDLSRFLDRVASEGRSSNRPFWLLASAYGRFLIGDAAGAKSSLWEYKSSRTDLFAETASVLDLMLRAQAGEFTPAFEQNLMQLDAKLLSDEEYDTRHRMAEQLRLYVAYQYAQHGDMIRATLLPTVSAISETYGYWDQASAAKSIAKSSDGAYVDDFVRLITKPNKTAYEAYLTKMYPIGSAAYFSLLDGLGSVYLRQYNFPAADRVFRLVPDSIWNAPESAYAMYLNQNPFVAVFGPAHGATDSVTYSKKTFTLKMIRLQQAIADPKSQHREAEWKEYADAFFNMTFYGNAWILVRDYWSRSEIESYYIQSLQRHLSQDDLNYYGCRAARAQYVALCTASRDPEIKAHCCMMISRCDRNFAYIKSKNPDEFKYRGDQYLTRFFGQYKKTEAFKNALAECPDRDAFVYWTKHVIE